MNRARPIDVCQCPACVLYRWAVNYPRKHTCPEDLSSLGCVGCNTGAPPDPDPLGVWWAALKKQGGEHVV